MYRTKNYQIAKPKLHFSIALVSLLLFVVSSIFLPMSTGTASAITQAQIRKCINDYNGKSWSDDAVWNAVKADGCAAPKGPCEKVPSITLVIDCSSDNVANPPAVQQWTKQKCINKYHEQPEFTVNSGEFDLLKQRGCYQPKGPCIVRLNITLSIYDCTGEYEDLDQTPQGKYCAKYETIKLNNACRNGYSIGSIDETYCDTLTGANVKSACNDGAEQAKKDRAPDDEDPSNLESCDSSAGFEGDPALCHTSCTSNDCNFIIKYVNPAINKFLAPLAVLAVVIGVIWGAITYSMSGGDPQKAAQGKSRIQKSLIGLVSFVFLYALLNWLIPGGV